VWNLLVDDQIETPQARESCERRNVLGVQCHADERQPFQAAQSAKQLQTFVHSPLRLHFHGNHNAFTNLQCRPKFLEPFASESGIATICGNVDAWESPAEVEYSIRRHARARQMNNAKVFHFFQVA